MRQPLVVGNWKMHGSRASVGSLLDELVSADLIAGVEVAICPSFLHIPLAIERCADSGIGVGGQDCSQAQSGAHTGETAAEMLADLGCSWVIVGHSERRQYHAESDALVGTKLSAALAAGLQPILCVGESREQREAGVAEAVVGAQLQGALESQRDLSSVVIAYEPVWAIGTGLTATPEQAQQMHAFIRGLLAVVSNASTAATRILYGGSVKPANAAELFGCEDIDGALVGGASLVAADFMSIVESAAAGAKASHGGT